MHRSGLLGVPELVIYCRLYIIRMTGIGHTALYEMSRWQLGSD